jgi:uncharacterized radical SAM superfamily Fe-S cluster-containing enzyme
MPIENQGLCNSCEKSVPTRTVMRDGEVYLIKSCEQCGETETLISSDAYQYNRKRTLDSDYDYRGCFFDCLSCKHPKPAKTVFLDITNRCNLNCPICIANVPSMGFRFEPPIEYFDKIFKHFGTLNPRPSIQLFGGEPTVREDLIEIIKLAHSYRVTVRVVTNGLRLADEDYCRELMATGVRVLFSYDGANEDFYSQLRGNSKALSLKLKALENIKKYTRQKITIMYVLATGFNDIELHELFQFLHDRSDFISAVDFIPITPTWAPGKFTQIEARRTTIEDVENAVNKALPTGNVEFLPAGVLDSNFFVDFFNIKSTPFAGVHPNCESVGLLVSNGKSYVPLSVCLKKPLYELAKEIRQKERSLSKIIGSLNKNRLGAMLEKVKLKKTVSHIVVFTYLGNILLGNTRMDTVLGAKGMKAVGKIVRIMAKLGSGHPAKEVLREHTGLHNVLRMIVLPFEDNASLESARLERCAAAFAYVDPEADMVKTIPVCAWGLHKNRILAGIAEHYGP